MCNLLRYKDQIQEVTQKFDEFSQIRIVPKLRYRVAPSEPAPVLTLEPDGRARVDMMGFGWRAAKGRQLMARGETAAKLRTFREAFQSRRCLVLAHGFYDSEMISKTVLQPWHLHRKEDRLMCFAGLWDTSHGENHFTIVSAPANAVVARVIDRMPVILPRESWRTWLDPKSTRDDLQPLLVTYPAEDMEAWRVTQKVNARGFESPECTEPLAEYQRDLGLF